jgi:carbonic anhydrase/acetyltransferase-like protein (isoleucine patch superfamily)
MKSLLICPDERIGVAELAESAPLANVPILGKSLVEYWLEHLAAAGAAEVLVLAVDRPDQVRAGVGDGARWGLRVTVQPDKRERTLEEARAKYQDQPAMWLPAPNDAFLMDHLPNLPHLPLFTSYADWFAAARALMPLALTPDRIGVRELKPGVWVGLRAHVAPDAKLIAPCWIGERAWIEAGAVIGPNAVLEREVFVARGAEVSRSAIGPETFVGQFTEVRNSIAWGSTLINWERDSCLKVPDAFLLCSREPQRARPPKAKTPAKARLRELVGEMPAPMLADFDPPG